ncbi:MAG: S41 family peptidase [Candidatus Shapirobacteria bacterium]|nr:S41 family peptidase [Candidatus Shapirobacteria bacterium]MDD3002268.1 S41 family peptidase [Candidatus Shapirobacteria bacterium]MDD4382727.1 S41 family peptidase [Candidatus Shapirobacteria bacterium]
MKFRNVRNLFVILALLSVVSLVSFKIGRETSGVVTSSNGDKLNLTLMWKVKDKLSQTFLEKDKLVDTNMEYGAVKGMVAALDDPYTVFLTPDENKSTNETLAGEFGGVGISLGYKDKTLAVMSPLAGTPAEKAGVKAGDLILHITDKVNNVDKDTTDIALDEAVSLIRGKIGTEVTLKMYREGKSDYFDVILKRDNIVVPNVTLEWKEQNGKKVALVRISQFTETLFTDWPKKVEEINAEKAKDNFGGIVLDLRNNPGGYLQASVLVASDFIKEGTIVTQKSYDGTEEKYNVETGRGNLLNDKLVVLINGGSASASEILAGALKDFNRAKLVGVKSFGKGTVQQPEDFSDGSGLHVTIAKWLLPSGKNIHKEGIMPDVEVNIPDDAKTDVQLEKAIETLLK